MNISHITAEIDALVVRIMELKDIGLDVRLHRKALNRLLDIEAQLYHETLS